MNARSVSRRVRREPPSRRGGRTAVRALLFAVVGAVSACVASFHVLLLWRRLADQTLLEPLVAARWLAAFALLGVFLRLRRARASLLWGRRALVFWLAVLLLHVGAVSPEQVPAATLLDRLPAAGLLISVQTALSLAVILGLRGRIRAAAARRGAALPRAPFLSPFGVPSRLALQAGYAPALILRPPPA